MHASRAPLAADRDRERGFDAPVHGAAVDVGVEIRGQPQRDAAVDRVELQPVVRRDLADQGVHAAVHRREIGLGVQVAGVAAVRQEPALHQHGRPGVLAKHVEVVPLKNLRERCFLILFEEAKAGRAVP